MTGRGHASRGGRSSQMPEFVLDTHRRGRGRPRKFPLSTPLQLPADVEQNPDDEFRSTEAEFYPAAVVEEDDRLDMEKIKQIQQQKMMIVTPMAQKRARGRPPRQSTSTSRTPLDEELLEEEIVMEDLEQANEHPEASGSSEGPSEKSVPPPPLLGRGSRSRQTPKRLNDFVHSEKKSATSRVQRVIGMAPLTLPSLPPPVPLTQSAPIDCPIAEDRIEPLIPNEAHIEETVDKTKPRKEHDPREGPPPKPVLLEKLEEGASGPPPAPRHLANKANSRGRPATHMVPPHRRPIPKDLMPPGMLKRVSLMKDLIPAKRKDDPDESSSAASSAAVPFPTTLLAQLQLPKSSQTASSAPTTSSAPDVDSTAAPEGHREAAILLSTIEVKQEPPEAVNEVIISESDGPPPMPPSLQQQLHQQQQSAATSGAISTKKEREAGKDLPSEHFPKEKARHVSTRGIVPFHEKEQMMQYDMRDQVLMHPDEMGQQSSGAQQRVLTLQGGSFIEDRIGRADLMEDEEMKMMKTMQQQQYIQVEENGVNVMYEDAEEVGPDGQYAIGGHQMQKEMEDDDDDDELPPQLVAEGVAEEVIEDDMRRTGDDKLPLDEDGNFDLNLLEDGEMIRLQSPGGRPHDVRLARDQLGNAVFIDEHGQVVELVTDTGALVEPNNMQEQQEMMEQEQQDGDQKKKMILQGSQQGTSGQINAPSGDRPSLEFSFLDTNNICCGLCGEIVLYEKLVSEHLPNAHPEYISPGVELEEVPYDNWLKTRLKQEMKSMQNGFRHYDEHDNAGFGGAVRLYSKGLRQLRKVSQIRVNVNEMTMPQLEIALKRKLVEKMGRKVPVSLVDRLHARCDICQAVVSLNKKFEVVHLVRHFNAWHPAEHRCSQEWKENQQPAPVAGVRRHLSLHDFAVVSTESDQNNLQCIWCGMFMDRAALGMHFTEVHSPSVAVPNCSLCLQEMVMTARLMEKYGEDFGISLPDEFHLHSTKLDAKFSSEKSLDKAIDKYLKRSKAGNDNEEDEDREDSEAICTTNSQQSFGRRNRLKRKFVKPCFRQICPTNSQFFEAISACEWKCRLCHRKVYGAVISAGAIKHFKEFHPSEIDNMQYELVKARLERIGDGSMEFVHPQLVECLICNLTYALHKPFNICRAIRHLRLKHPEVMPETAGKPISGAEIAETTDLQKAPLKHEIRFGEMITDPISLERFRKENYDQQFDKVQVVYGIKKNNEPAYILLMENEKMDMKTALEMAEKVAAEDNHDRATESRYQQMVNEDGEEEITDIPIDEQEDYAEAQRATEIYQSDQKNQMVLDFPEQIVEEETEEIEMSAGTQFIPTYDANNHVLIEENEIINDGNYEVIQEGDYQEMDEDNRNVRYLTEEELQEAQARGELLEYAVEEYGVEEYAEQQ
ncbi:unnamed protein product [Caenorhabditis sp. 36 PRJEB53466]|nr:unnamed protein product [Caenorhabditis sp. 36 PRJEB53466]